jgi:tRNA threonylcarbamoyladenosine biosynthesis protein TsaB
MKILAVDTTCLTASCAVVEDGRIIAELSTQHAKTHSQKLVPMIEAMMGLLEMKLDAIDLFAAAIGPGSFTGLRIGVVTIKGLAYALKRPVVGIPSLDALAYSVRDFDGIICPMIDARNNQVYTALYQSGSKDFKRVGDYMGIHISELADILKAHTSDILFLGDAASLHFDYFKECLNARLIMADPVLYTPRASVTALLAGERAAGGLYVSPFELEPLYLRKSQAERMKEMSS